MTPALLEKLTGMVVSTTGRTVPVLEVYTGEPFLDLPQSSPEDVETAYTEARKAQAVWAGWPLKRRLEVMKRFHELLLQKNLTVVDLMQAETGKARRMAFEETCDVVMTTSHYIKAAPRILKERKHGGVVPVVSSSTEVRVPKGIVGLISPWNFPFATSLSDAMPALIAGNGVVLKPDNKSTLNVAYGVSLLYEAGLPAGLVQVVCGEGPDIGPTIVANADYVMFTGSTATGRVIGALAGAEPDRVHPRARRQEPAGRPRRRRPRRRRPGRDPGDVPQRRPGLHAHRADLRSRVASARSSPVASSRRSRTSGSARPTTSGRTWARWSRWASVSGWSPTSTTPSRRVRPCSPAARPDRTWGRPSSSPPCSPT